MLGVYEKSPQADSSAQLLQTEFPDNLQVMGGPRHSHSSRRGLREWMERGEFTLRIMVTESGVDRGLRTRRSGFFSPPSHINRLRTILFLAARDKTVASTLQAEYKVRLELPANWPRRTSWEVTDRHTGALRHPPANREIGLPEIGGYAMRIRKLN
jgi:hypothetical protein